VNQLNYQQTLDYMLSALPMFHRVGPAAYKANLDNTYLLLDLLGNPEKDLPSIHIAGTNGKGSTSNMLASVLQEQGYKTALYTSPHLRDFRERIRVNGEPVSEEWVSSFVTKYKDDFDRIQPSFFEMTTAMAFAYFKEMKVDIAVIETGLGGRLDSTNVIQPKVSIITNIGWDHMHLLGNTLKEIAIEKAGIIKKDVPVIISETQEEVKEVFEEKAKSAGTELYFADSEWSCVAEHYHPIADFMVVEARSKTKLGFEIISDLTGTYQLKNMAAVITCVDLLNKQNFTVSHEALLKGLLNVKKNTGFKGRWYILQKNPTVLCDTAHNVDGLTQIIPILESIEKDKLHIVIGMVEDKEVSKVLNLFPSDAHYYFCKANIPRGMDANLLQSKAVEFNLKGEVYTSVESALSAAKANATNKDLIFVGGSTFTVAEVV
jgi:dihydrofolate synthase / folylpolyglutamate synthase